MPSFDMLLRRVTPRQAPPPAPSALTSIPVVVRDDASTAPVPLAAAAIESPPTTAITSATTTAITLATTTLATPLAPDTTAAFDEIAGFFRQALMETRVRWAQEVSRHAPRHVAADSVPAPRVGRPAPGAQPSAPTPRISRPTPVAQSAAAPAARANRRTPSAHQSSERVVFADQHLTPTSDTAIAVSWWD